jgi:cell division protein FtsB
MDIKRIFLLALLGLALVFLGVKVLAFWAEERNLNAELQDIQARLTKTQAEGASLAQDVNYLANPVNLEKELRTRFNYKKPGETMVILVPGQSSTPSGTVQ